MNHLVLGIMGDKGAGKDTVAGMFRDYYNSIGIERTRRIAIADKLKEEVAELLGVSLSWLKENKNQPYIRKLLQWYGVEFKRKHYWDSIWMDIVKDQIEATKEPTIFFIPDVRFLNEAKAIKEFPNSYILLVVRTLPYEEDLHISEQEHKKIPYDFLIDNNACEGKLKYQVYETTKKFIWTQS